MKKMLITRPNYDKGMGYLFAWSKEIVESAEEKNFTVLTADGRDANKKIVHSKLEKMKPEFVFFNGHGNKHEIYGHDLEPVMTNSSANLLKNTITFARSCNCLEELGDNAVSEGCRAFIGYSGQFWFPMINRYELNPLKDTAAKPVLEVSNTVPLKIIKNSTVAEAVDAARNLATKHILKLLTSEELYDRAALRALIQNDSCLDFRGDGNANIE
ncbi:MAG: hypothetical protein Q7K34_04245 [archaeon]|nr:hypothetical protein [archaeon]